MIILGKKIVINKLMTVQMFTKIRHSTSITIIVGKLPVSSFITLNITITGWAGYLRSLWYSCICMALYASTREWIKKSHIFRVEGGLLKIVKCRGTEEYFQIEVNEGHLFLLLSIYVVKKCEYILKEGLSGKRIKKSFIWDNELAD